MFGSKMLRSVCLMNSVYFSSRNMSNLSQFSKILNDSPEKLNKQFLNSRYIVNYKRKWNTGNTDKLYRTFICCKYLRLIKNAIRESGAVVELNPRLAHVIENAKKNNLSSEFIHFAKKISCDVRAVVGLYDLLLPSGCHFLIQFEDIDSAITKHHLLELCEKFDGTLFQGETIWPKTYEQKGFILTRCRDSDPLSGISKETMFKLGVESFHKEMDVEGVDYWKLYCDPWQLPEVKQQVFEITNNIEEAYVGYIPKKKIKVSHHIRNSIFSIFIKLCQVPTIDNVYININLDQ